MPVIDTHLHLSAPDPDPYPMASGGKQVADRAVGLPTSAEGLLHEMEEAGVDRAVFVQYQGVYGFDNSYIADALAAYPDRAAAVCIIDVLAPDAVAMLTELVVQRGVRGVRMMQTPSDPTAPWLHDDRALAVWDCAKALRIPVVLARSPGAVDPDPARHAPRVRWLLNRYPEVPVALDHLALLGVGSDGAALSDELLSLAQFPNLYCKLTTVNVYRAERAGVPYAEFFGPLFERFGADRVMWGSNYPATYDRPYGGLVALARQALGHLTVEDQERVFGETAIRLWPDLA